jgi:two-component sensor histidine kinase/predicted hydrocarbon binding protein
LASFAGIPTEKRTGLKTTKNDIGRLEAENRRLREENERLKQKLFTVGTGKTVIGPEEFTASFDHAEKIVKAYFDDFSIQPESGEIMISGERYVLFKSASLSYHFLDIIKELYGNRPPEEATRIGNNFLFDIAYVLGKKDAFSFHEKMGMTDPIEKLTAGPVHFAYTGWANVEVLPGGNPALDDTHYVKYIHHNSFEAQSWIKAGRKSDTPVCTMSCGYSSGWCEESFGIPLIAVEIECEAAGGDHCTFIMAPPEKIGGYLQDHDESRSRTSTDSSIGIPVFFEKKYAEDRLRASLEQKDKLLHEVHHRVKNNLQVISSLLNLQMHTITNEEFKKEFRASMMRITTMARIHEMIYSDEDVSSVKMEHYFRHLFLSLIQEYSPDRLGIDVELDMRIEDGGLEPDKAIPLGLILNEIVGCSFGRKERSGGLFRLELTETEDTYSVYIRDNGGGMERSEMEGKPGMVLIPMLCEQLDAELKIDGEGEDAVYAITFRK